MSARVLIADDDAQLREELAELLEERGYEVLRAETLDEAISALAHVDVAMLDVWLGTRSTVDWLSRTSPPPSVPVVVLSGVGAVEGALRGIRPGACALVHESHLPEQVLVALGDALVRRAVPERAVPLQQIEELGELEPRSILEALIEGRLRCAAEVHHSDERHVLFEPVEEAVPLSARKRRVLHALFDRTPIKAIARDLGVSEATVWSEIGALQERLGFRDRHQLLRVLAPLVNARRGSS